MERSLVLFAIGLIFGGGIGFVTAAGYGVTFDGHDHASHGAQEVASVATGHSSAYDDGHSDGHAAGNSRENSGGHAGHSHDKLVSLPAGPQAPVLDASLEADPVSGWNLHIRTENFTFAPDHAGLENVPGEGHAHVYVNGEKIARIYGPWFHIPSLPEGEALVEVTLNANDHSGLAVGDKPLKASMTVKPE